MCLHVRTAVCRPLGVRAQAYALESVCHVRACWARVSMRTLLSCVQPPLCMCKQASKHMRMWLRSCMATSEHVHILARLHVHPGCA
mmetsp:Transcript_19208/g.53773  ORF Transcript_19208/g.53773 Transcript_19208/m.53773 type:complete len:86 (+) Transcript_19208:1692-1949(+)